MSQTMSMALWTRNPIDNTKVAKKVLSILCEKFAEGFPLVWGDVEPPKISASRKDFANVITFWDTSSRICGRRIFGRGKQSHIAVHFLCGTSQQPHNPHFEVRITGHETKPTPQKLAFLVSESPAT